MEALLSLFFSDLAKEGEPHCKEEVPGTNEEKSIQNRGKPNKH